MIKKLLIANRGEIACRIIRTAKKMGIETVSIYSDIDKYTKHVRMADYAFHVGQNPSALSYLQADKIIQIAQENDCDAIHPGFGFLSENASFADNCEKNKLIFVGPPSDAIRKMGSKSESKNIMLNANVPCVPGYHGTDQDPLLLKEEANKIGYPVLIKAVLGGGGKGMRIVHKESEFLSALESAKRESMKSFNDDRVLVEKYITKPRHIEIQVFGDHFKNYVYLFERDCSIQRRHQKVIEEAPSNVSQALRTTMGESAIAAARAVNYYNAGTVEYVFDTETNQYYFMEMNTRLQVEHPVSEMITGQDLVQWQLMVASGMELPKKQNELQINGHAIEARIYSEDPFNNFLPANGQLKYLREPQEAENVRIESGIEEKDQISIFYDPMIAKLIVWGPDRLQAITKLKSALASYKVVGLPNNIKFIKKVCDNQTFLDGNFDTSFIARFQDTLCKKETEVDKIDILTGIVSKLAQGKNNLLGKNSSLPHPSFLNFRLNQNLKQIYTVNVSGQFLEGNLQYKGEVKCLSNGKYNISISKFNENKFEEALIFNQVGFKQLSQNRLLIDLEDKVINKEIYIEESTYYTFNKNGDTLQLNFNEDLMPVNEQSQESLSSLQKKIKAPMPGTVFKLQVKPGQEVEKDQVIAVLEAMKMEHNIKAPQTGKIKSTLVKEGSFVDHGTLLLEFE